MFGWAPSVGSLRRHNASGVGGRPDSSPAASNVEMTQLGIGVPKGLAYSSAGRNRHRGVWAGELELRGWTTTVIGFS